MKRLLTYTILLLPFYTPAQLVSQRLQKAFQQFEADSQLRHAISSLYVIDGATGQVVFDKNSQIGLAPASTQKVITSVTAFELLGKEYRYKTELGIIKKDNSDWISIKSSGDPTFGSSRFSSTDRKKILETFYEKLNNAGMKTSFNLFYVDVTKHNGTFVPDGWIWQDIGNYYGAGATGLNWRENQFDITFKTPNQTGASAELLAINDSKQAEISFINEVKAGEKGSGDNAYIYLPVGQKDYIVRGTIPPGQSSFRISGAAYDGVSYFVSDFGNYINERQMVSSTFGNRSSSYYVGKVPDTAKILHTHYSPSLDSIIYWFNKKSINLYGEALMKTFAYEKQGFSSTDSGVAIVKRFWKEKGLDEDELNISDGSGLSPLNRVTTHAQVEILKFAKKRDWFPYFYKSLPDYNGMAMKSGTISDVKGFCGYHKAKNGKEYIFSFLVNNYSGKTSALVAKMFKVLDELK